MRSKLAILTAFLLALTGLGAAPASATAYYQILNNSANICMGVSGGSTNNNAPVVLAACDFTGNQNWGAPNFHGYSEIRNEGNDNSQTRCLGVAAGRTNDGTPVVQYTCNGHPDQQWKATYNGQHSSDGFPKYSLCNASSPSVCLAIYLGTNRVVAWHFTGSPDQFWWSEGYPGN